MRIVKRLCREAFIGVLFSSLVYILTEYSLYSFSDRMGYLIIGTLVGLLTDLFKWDTLKPIYSISIHFIGTFILILLFNITISGMEIFKLKIFLQFILIFLIIYIIIWGISLSIFRNKVSKINDAIKKRNNH